MALNSFSPANPPPETFKRHKAGYPPCRRPVPRRAAPREVSESGVSSAPRSWRLRGVGQPHKKLEPETGEGKGGGGAGGGGKGGGGLGK